MGMRVFFLVPPLALNLNPVFFSTPPREEWKPTDQVRVRFLVCRKLFDENKPHAQNNAAMVVIFQSERLRIRQQKIDPQVVEIAMYVCVSWLRGTILVMYELRT